MSGRLRARRWRAISDQAICLHSGPVSELGTRWAAVIQGGPRAHLDGASALIVAGLERFTEERTRVTVPRGARVRRNRQFNIRQTRDPSDVVSDGIARSRPAVAAARGALWAASDRQATLLVTMSVQQGVVLAEELGRELLRRAGGRRYYLDLYWERWKLVVEIDAIQHRWAENAVGDALRQNALSLAGDTVLPDRSNVIRSGAQMHRTL